MDLVNYIAEAALVGLAWLIVGLTGRVIWQRVRSDNR